jgi:hypothetical protein
MSPIPLPITAFMRHVCIGVFLISLVASVGLAAAAALGEFDYHVSGFLVAVVVLLLSIIAYQVCRIREDDQPGDDSAVLIMAAIAELKAMRADAGKAANPPSTAVEEGPSVEGGNT